MGFSSILYLETKYSINPLLFLQKEYMSFPMMMQFEKQVLHLFYYSDGSKSLWIQDIPLEQLQVLLNNILGFSKFAEYSFF